jgi:hypothetical protein
MSGLKDPFDVIVLEEGADDFAALSRRPSVTTSAETASLPSAATARFHGFSLDDQPLVTGVAAIPREIVHARTTVPLVRAQIGSTVVLLFENNDVRRPIIVGVVQDRPPALAAPGAPAPLIAVQADDDRFVVTAEREIVLRCGDASITLTRAGKVIIKGAYILSRSSGYNKIKGAAVDIN